MLGSNSWKYGKIVHCLLRIGSVLKSHLIIVSTCYKINKTMVLFNLTLHVTEILEESCVFSGSFQEQFSVRCEVAS